MGGGATADAEGGSGVSAKAAKKMDAAMVAAQTEPELDEARRAPILCVYTRARARVCVCVDWTPYCLCCVSIVNTCRRPPGRGTPP